MNHADLGNFLKHNLVAVAAAVKGDVIVTYKGNCDSTDGTEVDGSEGDLSAMVSVIDKQGVSSVSVEDALPVISDQLIYFHGNEGYWNDAGGEGDVVISPNGEVKYTHTNFFEKEEAVSHLWENGDISEPFKGLPWHSPEKNEKRGKVLKQVIQKNWKELFERSGLHRVSWSYSGIGDSGEGIDSIAFVKQELGVVLTDTSLAPAFTVYGIEETKQNFAITARTAQTLEEFLEVLTDQLICYHGHLGFENNEGGGGSVIIQADVLLYNHYDNVEDEGSTLYAWKDGVYRDAILEADATDAEQESV